jgi:GTP cyclohydrolase I
MDPLRPSASTNIKPKSALPSHLTSVPSPLSVSQEVRDKKERDKLYASIESSNTTRHPVDLDGPNSYFPKKPQNKLDMNGINGHDSNTGKGSVAEEHARDPRDEAPEAPPSASRPESPFTQHPTIDFDGLSWPSMDYNMVFTLNLLTCHGRRRYQAEVGSDA